LPDLVFLQSRALLFLSETIHSFNNQWDIPVIDVTGFPQVVIDDIDDMINNANNPQDMEIIKIGF